LLDRIGETQQDLGAFTGSLGGPGLLGLLRVCCGCGYLVAGSMMACVGPLPSIVSPLMKIMMRP
jgi:hypothetical protein